MTRHAQLLEGPIGPHLRRLAVPMGLGIVFIIALNLADTYFVGMLGTTELAAMSFTFPVVSLVMSVVMGVGIGATSALAREIGAGDERAIRRLATHAIMLAIAIVIVISSLGIATQGPVFRLLGAQPDVMPLLRQYMTIWYLGAVFLVVPMIGMSALRATGDTRTPMFTMMTAAIVNVLLDPLLIFGWGPIPAMGLQGAAFATLGARAVTLALAIWLLLRNELLDLHLPTWPELRSSWWSILSVGLPAAVTNALAPVATAVLTWLIARHGTEAVAAYGVGSRLEGLLLIAPMALGAALTPFIGQNWGGHHPERVARALVISRNFVIAWGTGAWLVLALGGRALAAAFTDDPTVTELVSTYLWIVPLSYGAHGVVSVTSAAFNAVDKAVRSTILSALRSLGLAIPLAAVGSATLGLPGVFIGIAAATVGAAAVALLWLRTLTDKPKATSTPDAIHLEGATPAVDSALATLIAGVRDLDDIDMHPTRRRALGFFVGPRELGHVHHAGQLDLAFPPEIRHQLVLDDRVEHHRIHAESCWVTHRLQQPQDVDEAIWLLRLAHAVLRVARDPEGGDAELSALELSDELHASIAHARARWAA